MTAIATSNMNTTFNDNEIVNSAEKRCSNVLVDSIEQDTFNEKNDKESAAESPGSVESFSLSKQVENLKLTDVVDDDDDEVDTNLENRMNDEKEINLNNDGSQSDDSIELNNNRHDHNHNTTTTNDKKVNNSKVSLDISPLPETLDENLTDSTDRSMHVTNAKDKIHNVPQSIENEVVKNDLGVSVFQFKKKFLLNRKNTNFKRFSLWVWVETHYFGYGLHKRIPKPQTEVFLGVKMCFF